MYGNQSAQLQYSHPALIAKPGQAEDLDTRGKLGPLPRATGEAGELHTAGAEGTA